MSQCIKYVACIDVKVLYLQRCFDMFRWQDWLWALPAAPLLVLWQVAQQAGRERVLTVHVESRPLLPFANQTWLAGKSPNHVEIFNSGERLIHITESQFQNMTPAMHSAAQRLSSVQSSSRDPSICEQDLGTGTAKWRCTPRIFKPWAMSNCRNNTKLLGYPPLASKISGHDQRRLCKSEASKTVVPLEPTGNQSYAIACDRIW